MLSDIKLKDDKINKFNKCLEDYEMDKIMLIEDIKFKNEVNLEKDNAINNLNYINEDLKNKTLSYKKQCDENVINMINNDNKILEISNLLNKIRNEKDNLEVKLKNN